MERQKRLKEGKPPDKSIDYAPKSFKLKNDVMFAGYFPVDNDGQDMYYMLYESKTNKAKDRLLIMNTALINGQPAGPVFAKWKDEIVSPKNVDLVQLFKKYAPGISDADAKAYEAPFPDETYKAGVRKFPKLVAQEPHLEGVDTSLKAAEFWNTKWRGDTFMAVGMKDDMLGPAVMKHMQALIKGCPEWLEIAEGGHFVQEAGGELIAKSALEYFNLIK